ncbi:MAG: hypothetical protein KY464_16615, partial [Gemmatimonadetes bacterium]|nr:hypothetical protein [Gemmatimonadota bacterium]
GRDVDGHVARLGHLALAAGADGVVCSPHEAARLRQELGRAALIVTPGVRLEGAAAAAGGPAGRDAQKRVMSATAAVAAGCSAQSRVPAGAPVADPSATAAELMRSTGTPRLQRITFGWTLNEAGSKVSGRGVVRVDAPRRIRLDLFGPRNETVLGAALVDDEYRFPAGVTPGVALPSPSLFWGGMGVIRPPAGATLVGATAADSTAVLRYRATDGTTYQYETRRSAGLVRLENLERSGNGGRLETVRLTRDAAGRIQNAAYRNWAEFRELTLETGDITDVTSFPESTWQP